MTARMVGSLELHGAQVAIDGAVFTLAGRFSRENLLLQDLSHDARAWLLGTFEPELQHAKVVRVTCEGTWRYLPLYCAGRPLEGTGRLDVTASVDAVQVLVHKVLVQPFRRPALLRVERCGCPWPLTWDFVPEAAR